MLLRLAYLAVSSLFTVIRLLPVSGTDKDVEILVLRHQLTVLQRQIERPRPTRTDRAFLAALLHHLPRARLRQLQLIVSPDTILRWQRDLIRPPPRAHLPHGAAGTATDAPFYPGPGAASGP